MKEIDYKSTPLWDSSRCLKERLDYLVENLTVEEKLQFLGTGCPEVKRLGIAAGYVGGEAAHGVEARHDQGFNAGEPEPTTSFPQPIGMSSTWDPELIEEVGAAVGNEARVLFDQNGKTSGLSRWAPTVDMERDPRWGRTEEAYGEDPYLTGKMASAYIRGMRGSDPFYIRCAATLKHFYANNVERDRIRTSSSIDPRNKYEYYLEPFRRAVTEGGAEAVMTCYNEINGTPGMVNPEVQSLIKDSWGLPGHVVTDGGDVLQTVNDHKYFGCHAQTIAAGLKAGIDCFTDDSEAVYKAAREAYETGLITEDDLDRAIRHSFSTRIRLGMFDAVQKNPYACISTEFLGSSAHHELAKKAAEEAAVLLKNKGGLLPFEDGKKSIAVIGPLADVWYKDWYCGIPPYAVTPFEGIRKRFGEDKVICENGISRIRIRCGEHYLGLDKDGMLILTELSGAEVFEWNDWGFGSSTLKAVSCGRYLTADGDLSKIMGTMQELAWAGSSVSESDIRVFYDPVYADRLHLGTEEVFGWFIKEAFDLRRQKDGSYRLYTWYGRTVTLIDGKPAAIGIPAMPGSAQAAERRSRLAREEELQKDAAQEELSLEAAVMAPAVFQVELVEDGLKKAVQAAKKADQVVVVLGANPVINSKEEIDREDITLPPAQEALLQEVFAANPDTVLVLEANYPFAALWADEHIPAILTIASGSMELGNALAGILAGDVSPSGRLPMTWYRGCDDLPPMEDYDIIRGKRTYQYFDKEVLYPFGYGLSYSSFSYSELTVCLKDYVKLNVKVKVENKGKRKADEVVQIYWSKKKSRVPSPRRKLAAFGRLTLEAGESREASFEIPLEELKYYDVVTGSMVLEKGCYRIEAAASSEDIRLRQEICLEGEETVCRNPYRMTSADHYDDIINIVLQEGRAGCTAVQSRTEELPAAVGYRDMVFERVPASFILNCKAMEDSVLEVFIGSERLGDFTVRATGWQQFVRNTFEIDADRFQEIAGCGKSVELRMKFKENFRISDFWFE